MSPDERLITSCKLINVQRMTQDGDHLVMRTILLSMFEC